MLLSFLQKVDGEEDSDLCVGGDSGCLGVILTVTTQSPNIYEALAIFMDTVLDVGILVGPSPWRVQPNGEQ